MSPRIRSVLGAYGPALAATGLAILLRWLVDPWVGNLRPLAALYGAVGIAAFFGGYRAGILSATIGYVAAQYLFIEPRGTFSLSGHDQIVSTFAFAINAGAIVLIAHSLRAAQQRAVAMQRASQQAQTRLECEIAERSKAEDALQETYERNTTILGSISDAFLVLDREWRYVLLNPQAERYFGRPRDEMLGRSLWEVFPQLVGTVFEQEYRRALADDVAVQFETESPVTGRWVEVHAYPSPDGLSVLFQDVTARRHAQEELQAKEAQLRLITDAVPALISYVDPQCRYVWNNEAYEAWFSRPRESVIGLHLREVLGEAAWRTLQPHVELALSGQRAQFTTEITYQDGKRRWIDVTYSPDVAADGSVRGFVALVNDITIRQQMEEKIRQSEQRFVRFMQHLPGLAWIKDADGRYVYANEAAIRAFGMPAARVLHHTDEELFPPETAAEFRENDRRALARGAGLQTVETLLQPDGTIHHSVVSKFPIPGGEGEAAMVGGMAIDITELKNAEAALREADRRKDEFLATLAHELRNPLAPIRNAVHILRTESSPRKELQLARDIIDRQLAQMVRLVDDLLDVSRITRGKMQLRPARIALAEAVNSAVETSRPIIELAGHELTVSLPAEAIYLQADLTRLSQVLSNLLNNAAKYTDRGGKINLSVWREGSDVVVSVQDNGIGISNEQLPRIFEMFSQVTPALERTQGGLGIGLSLVRGLVEMHGGSVEARSAGIGHGSEFRIRLPILVETHATPQPRPADNFTPAGTCCRVLAVDDNQDAARSLALMLRALGHTVETAFDGAEALQVAEVFRPGVIFLDIGIPKFNGYEVARRLRQQPWGRGLTLIALTGWGQEEDKRLARESGFDHHLTKPATAEDLQRLISTSAVASAGATSESP